LNCAEAQSAIAARSLPIHDYDRGVTSPHKRTPGLQPDQFPLASW